MAKATRVLYWFRTDLRVHDSPALHAALALNPEILYPVWTWDPEYVFSHRVGVNRFNFLLESMHDLSAALTTRSPESRLLVVRAPPQTAIPALCRQWKITHLVYERDTAGYAAIRDAEVVKRVRALGGTEVLAVHGHTLYDPQRVAAANHGKPTMSLASWRKAAQGLPEPERPLLPPEKLPPPGDTDLGDAFTRKHHPIGHDMDMNGDTRETELHCYDHIASPNNDFAIPSMDELGLPPATTSIHGGETEALRRLDAYCRDKVRVATFAKPKTSPAEFDPPATTLLVRS